MIRIKDIQKALFSLVGWENSYSPNKAIDSDLEASESGLVFQAAHPMMTLDNIQSIMPEDFIEQYPDWNSLLTYQVGSKVKHGGICWIAQEVNTNVEPPANDFNGDYNDDYGGQAWRPYNILTDFLTRLTNNGIATVVQTFLQMKGLQQETKNLLERRAFFDGAGRLLNRVQSRGKLVGFEITPVRAMGVTTKLESIGLQMYGATGTVTMYLFHSSQVDPVATFDLNFTRTNGGFEWFSLDNVFLPYISDDNGAGGSWYLLYDQNALPDGMQAVNFAKDWSREPCGTCNQGSLADWRAITKYLNISPFCTVAPTTYAEFPELPDVGSLAYTNTQNYGINCVVSVGCDLTDFIISQRGIFATVLQRQVAATALRTMALNPDVRVNRNQSNASAMEMLYEIDGNTQSPRESGLGYELRKAYEALSLDTQGIDRVCLKCNNHGVKYTTA